MSSMNSRAIATSVAAVAAFSLIAACSSSSKSKSSGSTSASASEEVSGSLRLLASSTTQAGFAAEIKKFEAANPKVTINASYLPIEQVQAQVTTQLASGNGPDLFITNPGTGILGVQKLGKAGLIAPLDDAAWKSTVPAANFASLQYGGKTYGYPSSETLYFVLYNTAAFGQLNLTPPSTIADLKSDCVAATKAGESAIALVGGATNLLALSTTQLAINGVYSATPNWNDQKTAGTTSFATSAGWQQTIGNLADLKDAGCFQKDAAGTAFPDAVKLFTSGKALSMIAFSTQVGQIVASAPDLRYGAYPVARPDDRPDPAAGGDIGNGVSECKVVQLVGGEEVHQLPRSTDGGGGICKRAGGRRPRRRKEGSVAELHGGVAVASHVREDDSASSVHLASRGVLDAGHRRAGHPHRPGQHQQVPQGHGQRVEHELIAPIEARS